jgi:hypothetical protein
MGVLTPSSNLTGGDKRPGLRESSEGKVAEKGVRID